MRRIALAALLLAGCASPKHAEEGDRRFQARDFDGAAEAYARAREASPDDPELAAKLDAARKNAATVHAERAAKAAEDGDLGRALAEIGRSRGQEPEEATH
jgi:hypothetical protein